MSKLTLEKLKVRWTGIRPLVMHNGRLADPLDPFAKAMKKVSSRRKKEDSDHLELADLEWEGGLYFDSELGPFIPNDNIEACMVRGAKKNKRGKDMQAAVFVEDETVKLNYDGPRGLEKLKADARFRLRKGCRVAQSRIIRTRPMFPTGWFIEFTVEFDPSVIDDDAILTAMQQAGALIGIGDHIPKFGRFWVEVI